MIFVRSTFMQTKWILKLALAALAMLGVVSVASAQIQVLTQSLLPPDEARDLVIAGQRFYDEGRLADAESRFREVIRRFPKNQITDKADYYLIRTLAQTGKKPEALSRIDNFAKLYPKSTWQNDVVELRIQLTNQLPQRAEQLLFPIA